MSGQRYDVMAVREYQAGGETRTQWTKVGAAFVNRDNSIGVQLDAMPLNGKLVLQIPLTEEEKRAKYGDRARGGGGGQQQRGGNRYRGQSQPQQGSFGGYAPRQQAAAQAPAYPAPAAPAGDFGEPAGDFGGGDEFANS